MGGARLRLAGEGRVCSSLICMACVLYSVYLDSSRHISFVGWFILLLVLFSSMSTAHGTERMGKWRSLYGALYVPRACSFAKGLWLIGSVVLLGLVDFWSRLFVCTLLYSVLSIGVGVFVSIPQLAFSLHSSYTAQLLCFP